MRTSEQLKQEIIQRIDECAVSINALPNFIGVMIRVTIDKETGDTFKVFLSTDTEKVYKKKEKK